MEATRCKETNGINSLLLSAVSHELRTPIAAIKGYSTMLLDYLPELTKEETKEYIRFIDNATDSLTRLVDSLSDTSRLAAGLLKLEKTFVNIVDLIKEAVKEAETRDEHHKIITSLDNNNTTVFIDPARIRQVLDNLLENAAKCSPQGTKILIAAHNNGHELKISVTDHSPEAPADELSGMFEIKNKTEGKTSSGKKSARLGLYICQHLVAAHDGKIWADRVTDKGTTIQFTLPLMPVRSQEILSYIFKNASQ